jgi:hypothetical protein
MPVIATKQLGVWERLPGWRGRFYRGEAMSEEAWYVIAGELEITIGGEAHRAPAGSRQRAHSFASSRFAIRYASPGQRPET